MIKISRIEKNNVLKFALSMLIIYILSVFLLLYVIYRHDMSKLTIFNNVIIRQYEKSLNRGVVPQNIGCYDDENDEINFYLAIYNSKGEMLNSNFTNIFKYFHNVHNSSNVKNHDKVNLYDKPFLYSFKVVNGYRIETLIGLAKQYQELWTRGFYFSLLLLSVFFVILFVFWYILRNGVTNNLLRINKSLRHSLRNNFNAIEEIAGNDEIGDCSIQINNMIYSWRSANDNLIHEIEIVKNMSTNVMNNLTDNEDTNSFFNEFFSKWDELFNKIISSYEVNKNIFSSNIDTLIDFVFIEKINILFVTVNNFIDELRKIRFNSDELISNSKEWERNVKDISDLIVFNHNEISNIHGKIELSINKNSEISDVMLKLNDYVGKIENISEKTTVLFNEIERDISSIKNNDKRMLDVNDIVKDTIAKIEEIADQTNLLSLNASIISAQVGGEAGESFGIIATEIKVLSEDTVNNLQSILKSINNSIEYKQENDLLNISIDDNMINLKTLIDELKKIIINVKDSNNVMHSNYEEIGSILDGNFQEANKIKEIMSLKIIDKLQWIDSFGSWINKITDYVSTTETFEKELIPNIAVLTEKVKFLKGELDRYKYNNEQLYKHLSIFFEDWESIQRDRTKVIYRINKISELFVALETDSDKINGAWKKLDSFLKKLKSKRE